GVVAADTAATPARRVQASRKQRRPRLRSSLSLHRSPRQHWRLPLKRSASRCSARLCILLLRHGPRIWPVRSRACCSRWKMTICCSLSTTASSVMPRSTRRWRCSTPRARPMPS
ncbi:hypothetical protein GGF48_002246, partial [Coemansia sp. RSA 921]